MKLNTENINRKKINETKSWVFQKVGKIVKSLV